MAVRPPDEAREAVAARMSAAAVAPGADRLRWERAERLHLTLQFVGPVRRLAPVADGLAAAAGEREAFAFRLGGAGAFPNERRARVVWIGAATGGEAMTGLAGAVSAALGPVGYPAERGPYRPHLTVARVRVPGPVAPVLAALGADAVGPEFTVGEVVLYESRLSSAGATYSVLGRFPLRNA